MGQLRWLVAIALGAALLGCPDHGDDDPGEDDVADDDDDAGGDDDAGDDDTGDDDADDDDTGDDDTGDDDGGDDDASPLGEGIYTLAAAAGQIALIELDPDAGTWSELGRYGSWLSYNTQSGGFALFGDTVVVPTFDGWIEIDLVTGATQLGPMTYQQAVATDGIDLYGFCDGQPGLCRYPDFAALVAHQPSAVIDTDIGMASRMTIDGGKLYTAGHAGSDFHVSDLASGLHLDTVPLEGWDDWNWGICVLDGVLHLMRDSGIDQIYVRFDADTGQLLDETVIPNIGLTYTGNPFGLWCE